MTGRRGLAVVGILAVLAAGCGSASPPAGTVEPTLQVETEPGVGAVLTGPDGSPLYLFTADRQGRGTCRARCAATWIPFVVPTGAHAQGGPGVRQSLLGTVAASTGERQVTYNRWPLYTYLGDQATFTVHGEGVRSFGGRWWAVTPAGGPAPAAGDAAAPGS